MPPGSFFSPSLRTLNDVKREQFRGPRGTIAHRGRSGVYRHGRTAVGRAAPPAHRPNQPTSRQHPSGNINSTGDSRSRQGAHNIDLTLKKDQRNITESRRRPARPRIRIPSPTSATADRDSPTSKGAGHQGHTYPGRFDKQGCALYRIGNPVDTRQHYYRAEGRIIGQGFGTQT